MTERRYTPRQTPESTSSQKRDIAEEIIVDSAIARLVRTELLTGTITPDQMDARLKTLRLHYRSKK